MKRRVSRANQTRAGSTRFEITVEELGALLSGIDLSSAVRRKRYRRAIA
jgi:hypothetical protein